MNILVVDVAASVSGALTVLKEYYQKAIHDGNNRYFFCVSVVPLDNSENVTVLSYPWVKKSWLHRLYFDCIYVQKIIKKYKIDRILSLQNLTVPFCELHQTVYLHQSLPFSGHRFSIVREPKLWVYQNIIGRMIFRSLKKADEIIVQTEWMKDVVIKVLSVPAHKIMVVPPKVEFPERKQFNMKNFHKRFFYPATGLIYKNHIVIFKAVELLNEKGINDFKVVLTLTEDTMPKNCRGLYKKLKDNFELKGLLKYEQVVNEYCESVLLFPSFVETFGLPLLEAKILSGPVIASNEKFSHEILDGYEKGDFFSWDAPQELAALMEIYL